MFAGESPEAGPVLRLRTVVVGAGPLGARAWAGRSRALVVLPSVPGARHQEPLAPDGAPAEPGGVSSM